MGSGQSLEERGVVGNGGRDKLLGVGPRKRAWRVARDPLHPELRASQEVKATPANNHSAGSGTRDRSAEESALNWLQVWPGAKSGDEGALGVWEEASHVNRKGRSRGRVPLNGLGLQIALELVHLIDTGRRRWWRGCSGRPGSAARA